MTFEELLARCKCGVYLTVNQHRDVYQTVEQYIEEQMRNSWADTAPDRADDLVSDTLVELTFYPDTPVGSYHIIGSTLDAVLSVAAKCLGL